MNTDKDYGIDKLTDPRAIMLARKIVEVLEEDLGKDFYISSVNAPLFREGAEEGLGGPNALFRIDHEEGAHKCHFDMDACYNDRALPGTTNCYEPFEKMMKALEGTGFYIEAYSTWLSHVYEV